MTLQEEYELSCYRVLDRLKEKKEVYLVRHVETGQLCVKKQIDLYNRKVYERLRTLEISGIPKIYCSVEQDQKLVVIEEYIHGKTLEEYLEEHGSVQEDTAVSFMLQLCEILKQLHSLQPPVIHRDLKLSNIMISNDGVIKLVDFNAAKEVQAGQMEDTYLMGTRDYAAPEQYGFGQSDARTDIYALGIILNKLLTGDFPKNKRYEGTLGAVIQTCIQMDAEARYQSVEDLKMALKRCCLSEKKDSGTTERNANVKRKNDAEKKAGAKRHAREKPQMDPNNDSRKRKRKNIGKEYKELYPPKWYLPVGFRTGRIWKILTAVFGYWMITYCCLGMEFHDKNGALYSGYVLWVNRIMVWIYMLFSVFFVGNYAKMRKKFPGMKGSVWKQLLFGCGYLFLFLCAAALIISILGG